MKTAFCLTALLLGLCLNGCRHDYDSRQMQVVANGVSQTVPGSLVGRDFFTYSGARPYVGRFFLAQEFQIDRPTVAVVSHKYWRDSFRSRPEIIGSTIQLDGRFATIVGVAEPGFAPYGAGDLWVPRP